MLNPSWRTKIQKFLKSFLRLALKLYFFFVVGIKSGKFLLLTDYSLYILRQHKKFPRIQTDNARLLNAWDRTNDDFRDGKFIKSIAARARLLNEADEVFTGIHNRGIQFYSHEFGSNIGHLAILAIHQEAMKHQFLPERDLELPIDSGSAFSNFWIPLLFPSLRCRLFMHLPNWTELPSMWSVVERFPLFRQSNGFINQFSLTEKVYSSKKVNKSNRLIKLPPSYLERARDKMKFLGLPFGIPFIALHVRSGKEIGVRRSQSPDNFERTVDELVKKGYFVIRIGNQNMEPMRPRLGFIDLSQLPSLDWLHPYVLHEAFMFIGTNSGPTWMSQVFGTPTLMTNATSLARSVLSGCDNTLYIPKKVEINGIKVPLRDLLSNTEGYSELDNERLVSHSIVYFQNTEVEILHAALELLDSIENQNLKNEQITINDVIKTIRQESGAIAFGNFASSFIAMHDWFLNE